MLNSTATLIAAPDQVSCGIGSQKAILNLKNGIYYGLDSVGSRVWELVQTPLRFDDLKAILLDEYEVEPERLCTDLQKLCKSLVTAGLLEVRSEMRG